MFHSEHDESDCVSKYVNDEHVYIVVIDCGECECGWRECGCVSAVWPMDGIVTVLFDWHV
jgi:hypothetical protein